MKYIKLFEEFVNELEQSSGSGGSFPPTFDDDDDDDEAQNPERAFNVDPLTLTEMNSLSWHEGEEEDYDQYAADSPYRFDKGLIIFSDAVAYEEDGEQYKDVYRIEVYPEKDNSKWRLEIVFPKAPHVFGRYFGTSEELLSLVAKWTDLHVDLVDMAHFHDTYDKDMQNHIAKSAATNDGGKVGTPVKHKITSFKDWTISNN